jgi:uncharacterized membrane protein
MGFFELIMGLIVVAVLLCAISVPVVLIVLWIRVGRLREQVTQLRSTLASFSAEEHLHPVADEPQITVAPERPADARKPKEFSAAPPRPEPAPVEAVLVPDEQKSGDENRTVSTTPPPNARSLEELLAGQWMTWVGALAVVIGVGFFFKYTIENNLIGETGRVVIGLLAGMICFAGGAYGMLKDYRFLAQGLVGAAFGILYFSLFAAFGWYEIIPQSVAFGAMILVTVAALSFSAYFNVQATAILGLIGGFLTPIMLTTEWEVPWTLFSYVLLLDLGVLGLASFRKWQSLQILAFVSTLLMWLGWLESQYGPEHLGSTLILMTAFFLLFALLGIWHNVLRRQPAVAGDFFLILATPIMYFIGIYGITKADYSALQGVMAIVLAGAYLALGVFSLSRNPEGRKIVICLGGIAASFLTVAIPLQLTGHWIAIAWAAESLLLVELGLRFREVRLRWAGFGLLFFVQLILFSYTSETFVNPRHFQTRFTHVDPVVQETVPSRVDLTPAPEKAVDVQAEPSWTDVFNGRSFSFLASAIVMSILAWEYRKRFASVRAGTGPPLDTAGDEPPPQQGYTRLPEISTGQIATWLMAGVPLTLLGLLIVETFAFGYARDWIFPTFVGFFSIWTAIIGLVLISVAFTWGPRWLERVGWGVFGLLGMFLAVNTMATLAGWRSQWHRFQNDQIADEVIWNWMLFNPRGIGFMFAIAAAVVAAVLYQKQSSEVGEEDKPAIRGLGLGALFGVFAHVTALAMLTVEVYAHGVIRDWHTATALAVTGVWTLYAIGTLLAGIYFRSASVRVLSLCLFVLTTAKVFLYDVWHLDATIRTFAFVGLGIALLAVSFLYRRYRDRIRDWIAPPVIAGLVLAMLSVTSPLALADDVGQDEQAVNIVRKLSHRWPIETKSENGDDTVAADPKALFRIVLPPDLYGHARRDLADLRVLSLDEAGVEAEEIPFVLLKRSDQLKRIRRKAPMLNPVELAGHSQFLLEVGETKEPVDELAIKINDADRNYARPVKVYGSDRRDADQWGLLTSDGYIIDRTRTGHRLTTSNVTFPQSRFRFYRIEIDNLGQKPIRVVSASLFDREEVKIPRREMPSEIVSQEQNQETKSTELIVDLGFDGLPTDGLMLAVRFDGDYYRHASLEVTDELKKKKAKWRQVANGDLYHIDRPGMKATNLKLKYSETSGRYLRLTIDDGDDQPLVVTKCTALRIERLLVARRQPLLQSGRTAGLYSGNDDKYLVRPSYDLRLTIGKVAAEELPELALAPMEENPLFGYAPKVPWSEANKGLLWTITLVGIVGLGALTFLMLRMAASSQGIVEGRE